ncbi:MAG: hypothetical protein Q7J82_01825 [Coriobacteriia bacterium]|nr:hypothetical protein [Coriobacteriia bacterium]
MYGFERTAPFMDHSFGLLGGLFGLLVSIAVIAVIVAVIIKSTHHSRVAPAGQVHAPDVFAAVPATSIPAEDEPLRIARERLARGEIDPEQYRAIAEALST